MRKNILIAVIVLIISLCLFLVLFYNQERTVAQDETEKEVILCDPEIPIGETMEEAAVLLSGFINELQSANYQVSKEIEAAETMISLAEQCDVKKCQPVCNKVPYECGFWRCPPKGKCVYVPKTCYRCDIQLCSGQPCPNEQIRDEFNKIETYLSQVVGLSGRLKNLLVPKTDIADKLAESRQEFDNCYFSPSDWLAAERGEKTPRYTLICTTVLSENLPREEEECKSLFNFFCCH